MKMMKVAKMAGIATSKRRNFSFKGQEFALSFSFGLANTKVVVFEKQFMCQ